MSKDFSFKYLQEEVFSLTFQLHYHMYLEVMVLTAIFYGFIFTYFKCFKSYKLIWW